MRLPKNLEQFKKHSDSSNVEIETLKISVDEHSPRYNSDIFFEEKAKKKFIQRVEKIVRKSYEYRVYIDDILKNELNITKCTAIPGIDLNEIKAYGLIEFHHYPLTLYDITEIELNKLIESGETKISPYLLAHRINELHFKNLVGLVPLSVTVHQLVHDGKYFINKKYCISNLYEEYINRNDRFISDEIKEKLEQLDDLSWREDNGEEINGSILDLKFLNVVNVSHDEELNFSYIETKEENNKTA